MPAGEPFAVSQNGEWFHTGELIPTVFTKGWPRSGMVCAGEAFTRPSAPQPQTMLSGARFWPTPTTSDYKGATQAGSAKKWAKRGTNLPEAVQLAAVGDPRWPNPPGTLIVFDENDEPFVVCEGCLEPHPGRWNGTLNPDWVEWLMGFPTGWTVTERGS